MSVTLHGQCFSAGPLLRLLPLHITCHAIPAASAHRRSLIIYCRAASLGYTFLHQENSKILTTVRSRLSNTVLPFGCQCLDCGMKAKDKPSVERFALIIPF